jgi:hypothetical protein
MRADPIQAFMKAVAQEAMPDMPLTKKGSKIIRSMRKAYGKKAGDRVFYASQNKGTIKGTHRKRKKK